MIIDNPYLLDDILLVERVVDERQGELHPHPVAADEVIPLTDDDVHGVVVVKVDEPELPVEGSLVKL